MKRLNYTDEQKEMICKLCEHYTQREIAELLNISPSAVYYITHPLKDVPHFKLNELEDRRRKLTSVDILRIITIHTYGVPIKTIAQIFNVSTTTIRYHLLPLEERRKLYKNRRPYGTKEYKRQAARNTYHYKKSLMEKLNGI